MLEDYWYIACRSKNLRRHPLALTIMGRRLALFRSEAGQVAALQDRCVHRNAPLSQGKVCGNSLQCPYHGWRYNAQGDVVDIPALVKRQGDDFPAGVKSYPCIEQQGYVWVCLSAQPAQPAPTMFAGLNQPGWTSFHMQTRFEAAIEACLENFLDCPHATHVHQGWFRSRSRRELRASVQMLEDGAQAEYFEEPRERSLVWSLLSPKKEDMKHIDRFIAPATTRVDYGFSNGMHYRITSSCTPINDFSSEVFTVISFRIKWVGWLVRLYFKPLAQQIIKQDVAMLTAQQRNIIKFGGPEFEVVEPDLLHNGIRQWRTALKSGSTLPPAESEPSDVKLRL